MHYVSKALGAGHLEPFWDRLGHELLQTITGGAELDTDNTGKVLTHIAYCILAIIFFLLPELVIFLTREFILRLNLFWDDLKNSLLSKLNKDTYPHLAPLAAGVIYFIWGAVKSGLMTAQVIIGTIAGFLHIFMRPFENFQYLRDRLFPEKTQYPNAKTLGVTTGTTVVAGGIGYFSGFLAFLGGLITAAIGLKITLGVYLAMLVPSIMGQMIKTYDEIKECGAEIKKTFAAWKEKSYIQSKKTADNSTDKKSIPNQNSPRTFNNQPSQVENSSKHSNSGTSNNSSEKITFQQAFDATLNEDQFFEIKETVENKRRDNNNLSLLDIATILLSVHGINATIQFNQAILNKKPTISRDAYYAVTYITLLHELYGSQTKQVKILFDSLYKLMAQEKEWPAKISHLKSEGKSLGEGTYADVFRAKHNNKTVAVKNFISHEGGIDTFIYANELYILFQLKGKPYIINLLAFAFDPTSARNQIIIEYAPRGDLSDAIPTGIKPDDQIRIFWQIAVALHAMHALNIFHRDLTPKNILMMENGDVAVSDFGSSGNFPTSICATTGFAQAAELLAYYSKKIPIKNQYLGKTQLASIPNYSAASDVWALGRIGDMMIRKDMYLKKADKWMYGADDLAQHIIMEDNTPCTKEELSAAFNSKNLDYINCIFSTYALNPDDRPTIPDIISKFRATKKTT